MDDERSNEMSNSIMPLPQAMGRRTFLGGLTAASFGVLLQNAFAEPVRSQIVNYDWRKHGSPRFF
jgi:hypothetical protein